MVVGTLEIQSTGKSLGTAGHLQSDALPGQKSKLVVDCRMSSLMQAIEVGRCTQEEQAAPFDVFVFNGTYGTPSDRISRPRRKRSRSPNDSINQPNPKWVPQQDDKLLGKNEKRMLDKNEKRMLDMAYNHYTDLEGQLERGKRQKLFHSAEQTLLDQDEEALLLTP